MERSQDKNEKQPTPSASNVPCISHLFVRELVLAQMQDKIAPRYLPI